MNSTDSPKADGATPADGSVSPPAVQRSRIHPNDYPMPGLYANTTGIILPKTRSAPAGGNTDPAIDPETETEESWWQRWGSEAVHGALDAVGLVPGLGEGADLINAGIYLPASPRI